MLLTVSDISDSSLMAAISTSQSPNWNDWMIVQYFIVERCVLEVLLHHILMLFSLFVGVFTHSIQQGILLGVIVEI